LALAILRLVGEEARKERTAKVIAQLPMDVTNYVLNEKRDWVQSIQDANGVAVVLIGNPDLETPNYSLRRVRDDEALLPENAGTSYKLLDPKPDPSVAFEEVRRPPKAEEAAVSGVLPSTPAPTPPPPPSVQPTVATRGPSLWQRLFGWLSPAPAVEPREREPRAVREHRRPQNRDRDRPRGGQSDQRGRERDRGPGGRNKGRGGRPQGGDNAAPKQMREPGTPAAAGTGSGRSRRSRNRRPSGQRPQGQEDGRSNGPRQEHQRQDSGNRRAEGNGSRDPQRAQGLERDQAERAPSQESPVERERAESRADFPQTERANARADFRETEQAEPRADFPQTERTGAGTDFTQATPVNAPGRVDSTPSAPPPYASELSERRLGSTRGAGAARSRPCAASARRCR
jgi:ribonuclease E